MAVPLMAAISSSSKIVLCLYLGGGSRRAQRADASHEFQDVPETLKGAVTV